MYRYVSRMAMDILCLGGTLVNVPSYVLTIYSSTVFGLLKWWYTGKRYLQCFANNPCKNVKECGKMTLVRYSQTSLSLAAQALLPTLSRIVPLPWISE